METFLKQVAHDLYTKLEGDFSNVAVIFPNKRASLFFNEYLAQEAAGRYGRLPISVSVNCSGSCPICQSETRSSWFVTSTRSFARRPEVRKPWTTSTSGEKC